jgi:hypothetical protein
VYFFAISDTVGMPAPQVNLHKAFRHLRDSLQNCARRRISNKMLSWFAPGFPASESNSRFTEQCRRDP